MQRLKLPETFWLCDPSTKKHHLQVAGCSKRDHIIPRWIHFCVRCIALTGIDPLPSCQPTQRLLQQLPRGSNTAVFFYKLCHGLGFSYSSCSSSITRCGKPWNWSVTLSPWSSRANSKTFHPGLSVTAEISLPPADHSESIKLEFWVVNAVYQVCGGCFDHAPLTSTSHNI